MHKLFISLTTLIGLYLSSSHAQITEFKLAASDGDSLDQFGVSVSISGDYIIVGARFDDDNGENSGSAYIFKRKNKNWIEQAKLTASDGAAADQFGYNVSISGNYAIVGARFDDDNGENAGAAYVFRREGKNWIEQSKLTASDGDAGDRFGIRVSLSDDCAIVGAIFGGAVYGVNSGSAYIFKRDNEDWLEQSKLTAYRGQPHDRFGISVSISSDYAIVGAGYDDDKGLDSGLAYIYKQDGENWQEKAKLTASNVAVGYRFGISASMSGDYAIVGSALKNRPGSAYIFKRKGISWTESAELTAQDVNTLKRFGSPVAIFRDFAIVGASFSDDKGDTFGAAYVFKRNGEDWVEQAKLTASDGAANDYFGNSVSIFGNYAIIGALFDDDNGKDSGSAYVFTDFPVTTSIEKE